MWGSRTVSEPRRVEKCAPPVVGRVMAMVILSQCGVLEPKKGEEGIYAWGWPVEGGEQL